jgi:hypothetical protein
LQKLNKEMIIMKKLFFIAVISMFGLSQAYSQTAPPAAPAAPSVTITAPAAPVVNPNAPKANWDKTVNDFGEIEQGIPKEAQFTLTNEGKEPLLIQTAKAGCGCTNLKYSQEPILPGKSSIVAATYNAAAMGQFTKSVTVTTNADPNPVMLMIKGTVIAKKM